MQKIYDEQHINILNKDGMQRCAFVVLPQTSVLTQPLEFRIRHLQKQHTFTKFSFSGCFTFSKQLILNKAKD